MENTMEATKKMSIPIYFYIIAHIALTGNKTKTKINIYKESILLPGMVTLWW